MLKKMAVDGALDNKTLLLTIIYALVDIRGELTEIKSNTKNRPMEKI